MALYDHRVFRSGETWWIAQVHSGGGSTRGSGIPSRISRETVIFTCLTDRDANSRYSTAMIPSGWLNRMRHSAITALLEAARLGESRFEMWPYNTPSEEELGPPAVVDDEGLRWVVRQSRAVRLEEGVPVDRPALELICLDDSALRKEVLGADEVTLDAFVRSHGALGLGAVVAAIKSTFLDLPSWASLRGR